MIYVNGYLQYFGQKTRITPEGGLAVLMINKTGGASTKGYIVENSATTNNGVQYTTVDDIDPIGVMYETGIPDGSPCWVVVSGIAHVYYATAVIKDSLSRVPVTAEGYADGQAVNEALPTSPFATDKHFQEIGHPIETRGTAGLALTVLHFN